MTSPPQRGPAPASARGELDLDALRAGVGGQLLADIDRAVAWDVAMKTPFRGLTRRDGVLLHGPAGWGELAPFWDYDAEACSPWLASALEQATVDLTALPRYRETVPVNITVPAVDPARARALVTAAGASAGTGPSRNSAGNADPIPVTVKIKVTGARIAERRALAADLERVEAVRDAIGPHGRIRIDVNGAPSTGPTAAPETTSLPARGRRVLVIGAGRGQLGLIRAVKRLGATAVVASLTDGPPPGLKEADEAIEVNLLDPDAVAAQARLAGVDAVATSCLDTGLEALGTVVDELGLRGITRAAARLCMDKLAMKRRLAERGVPTAPFREVTSLEEVAPALEQVGVPAMVKAADLQGSSGVFKVASVAQARDAFRRARTLSRHGTVLIERFLDGHEFGAQALIHDGELLHVTVHGDDLAPGGLPIPVGHHLPLDLPAADDTAAQAREATAAAVRALGLDNCAVNIDLMACDGQVYVIELSARAGANGLPELMSAIHGLDYYELVAREALDLDVAGTWQRRSPWPGAALALMLTDPHTYGTVAAVDVPSDLPDWVEDLTLFRGPGDRLEGFSSSNDCLGQVVVRGEDLAQCRQRAQDLAAQVSFIMQEAS
ncbi:ATP-grasp domain-containing protein [Actinomyces sp. MRS3W]|uniref:ATP-binding protein n=1 Tax=Actinomyces sp. MRS3W TaxID=2800796 RepID=UPI0028FD8160|nr:ATP-grasp domain-containing protein [Actinomyces sp. MRS3W]MDU0348856.1 ATP-grasp domain-containing protein [Actinomyces sp. MRS3W]